MRTKRINLILQDGTPFGLRTAEVSNWNGKVVLCPRSALKQLRTFDLSEQPALYILVNEERTAIYIGETDALSQRLANHAVTKEFWSDLLAFTSPELSKTEVRYLEHVLLARLQHEKRIDIQNSKNQQAPTIRKDVQDAMDDYLDIAADVLLALGVDILTSKSAEQQSNKGLVVYCNGPDAQAIGVWSQNGLLVRAGALVRKEGTATMPEGVKSKVDEYKQTDLLEDAGESYRLTRDHLFTSASSAAAFVLGRSANGLIEWKTEEGITIKEMEQQEY